MKSYGLEKYGLGIIGCLALTLLISPFRAAIDFSNIALLYVLLVVVTAIYSGRGPAIVTAVLGSLAFAYVFVPPYFSLAITEVQHLISALIMLVVALLVGHLTSRLKNHVESAEARERHSRALYLLASQLTATQTAEEVQDISKHFLTTLFSAENVRILSPDTFDDLPAPLSPAGLADIIASRNLAALPILVLSARSLETEKVAALDAGADDYLTKPFGVSELLARVRALLRRRTAWNEQEQPLIRFGEFEIDCIGRVVRRAGESVHLTQIEYRLLLCLATHPGRVMTHRQLLAQVWGAEAVESHQYLRVYVGHLRQKIEADPARPRHLLTESGAGYRFQP